MDSSENSNSSTVAFLKFLKLIRLLRLTRILSKIKSESIEVFGTLFKYFFILMLVLHWMTLIWWSIISSSDTNYDKFNESNTWLPIIYHVLKDSSNYNANSVAQEIFIGNLIPKHIKYIYTLYSMIMLVLGGEVTPITTGQGFAATCFAFIGQLTIAIIFANMSTALVQIKLRHELAEEVKEKFGSLMIQLSLPKPLRERIDEYIHFCLHKKIIFDRDLNDFSILNQILQQEISLVINEQIIMDTPLFSQLQKYEISMIMSRLSTRVLMPNEVVFEIGEVLTEMYFIVDGVVQMTKPYGDDKMKTYILSAGEHFGEYAVMQAWRCDYSVKSLTFTITQILSKQVLENVISQSPAMEARLNEGQKLYKQEEKLTFYNTVKDLSLFEGFNQEEIVSLYINYVENINVDPNQIIIVPEELIRGLYIILDGTVHVYEENSQLNKVNIQNLGNSSYKDTDIFYNSVDDNIYQKIASQEKLGQLQEIQDRVHLVGEIGIGQYFGLIDHNLKRQLKNQSLVLMSSQYSVKLAVINQNIMQIIYEEDIDLYNKLMQNIKKIDRLFPQIQKINITTPRPDEELLIHNESNLEDNNMDVDEYLLKLRDNLYSAYKEVKDIHRKMRVVKPPLKNIKLN